jgi:ribosome modulation factor
MNPYLLGLEAFLSGQSFYKNPFDDEEAHDQWEHGWLDGMGDYQNENRGPGAK